MGKVVPLVLEWLRWQIVQAKGFRPDLNIGDENTLGVGHAPGGFLMLECDGGQANSGRRDKLRFKGRCLPSDCPEIRLPPERFFSTLGHSFPLHDNSLKDKGQSV